MGESTGDKSEPGEYSAQSIQVSFKLLKVRVSGWALYNCLIRKWSNFTLFDFQEADECAAAGE